MDNIAFVLSQKLELTRSLQSRYGSTSGSRRSIDELTRLIRAASASIFAGLYSDMVELFEFDQLGDVAGVKLYEDPATLSETMSIILVPEFVALAIQSGTFRRGRDFRRGEVYFLQEPHQFYMDDGSFTFDIPRSAPGGEEGIFTSLKLMSQRP